MKKAGKLNKEIRKINKKLASMSLSDEERNNYEFRLKAIRDEADAIEYATRQGIEQGQEQEKKETVKRMLRKNVKVEDIVEFTGLTKEEIEKIKNEE